MTTIQTVNPSLGKPIATYPLLTQDVCDKKIAQAHEAFNTWKHLDFTARAKPMRQLAAILRQNKAVYAQLMAKEMGKPITAGENEIEKCAWVCDHYAQHSSVYLAPQSLTLEKKKCMVCYEPIGIIFGIMPWNFPFWQVFRFAAPTLMAGNAVLLKHAPISTGTGLLIQDIIEQAGFPPSLFQTLILDNEGASKVIAHPHIAAVTFTGSTQAGRDIAQIAGQHLKKIVLELGGNDPYVILNDADILYAANCLVTSRLNNTGQSCIAPKRIIVVETIIEPLIQALLQSMERYACGDPLDPSTTMGPIAREDLRLKLHHQIMSSQALGAKILIGGELPSGPGFFYPKTLLTGVKPGMPAFDEELFGPVLSLIAVKNEAEAIALANQSSYGLGGGIFTQDIEKGQRIAREGIETGNCFVNGCVSSDPRLPFGGIKSSGMGRELSEEGQKEFVNIKTICVV